MLFNTPRTATAMALALGLSAPIPVIAQAVDETDLPECMEMVTLPCVTATGATVEDRDELDIYLQAFPEEAAAAAERAAQATAERLDEMEPGDVEAQPDVETEAPEVDAPEVDTIPDAELPDTDVVPETEVPDAEVEAAEDADADFPEVEIDVPEDATEAPADAPVTDAPVTDAPVTEAPVTEAPVTDAPVTDAPVTDAPVTDAPVTDAPVTDAPVTDAPATDAPVTDAPVTDEDEAAVPETTVEDDIPEVSSVLPPEDPAEATVADDIPEVSSAVPPDALAAEPEDLAAPAETAPPPAAAAAAAADAAEGAEVEDTVITQETARTSAEDFATTIQQQVAPATPEAAETTRRDTLQRALAAGLAGVALGALLDQGSQVAVESADRLVLRQDDGDLRLFRDENALLRQPGARVRTETFDDGSTRNTVVRDDGTRIVTIRASDGTILRRTRVLPDGRQVLLIDDMTQAQAVDVSRLPEPRREAFRYTGDEEALRRALAQALPQDVGRTFSLRQIREIDRVRYLAPEIEIDAITFATASAAIEPGQAQQLAALGRTMRALIEENPAEVFLVEGHTDAVGDASYNLALSDRRAESVALALIEYFDVPPENLVVQGYGEFDLKIETEAAERQNRRANVRRITGLLGSDVAGLR